MKWELVYNEKGKSNADTGRKSKWPAPARRDGKALLKWTSCVRQAASGKREIEYLRARLETAKLGEMIMQAHCETGLLSPGLGSTGQDGHQHSQRAPPPNPPKPVATADRRPLLECGYRGHLAGPGKKRPETL